MIEQIIEEEAEKIYQKYRIGKSQVKDMLSNRIHSSVLLFQKISQARNIKQLKRNKDYKNLMKKIRKDLYYSLRRYHRNEEKERKTLEKLQDFIKAKKELSNKDWPALQKDLISLHISAWERAPDQQKFNQKMLKIIQKDQYILDIGSGFYPLSFPFLRVPNLKEYICLEKDKKAVKALKIFSSLTDKKLIVFSDPIGEKEWKYYLPKDKKSFDTVLMLKLIPVIARQQRHLIEKLAQVPAQKIIITANKEAMTKKQSIFRREDKKLKEFIDLACKKIEKRLDFETEFGYLIV